MNSVNKLLKGKDVAQVLNISKAFAYRLMEEGQIPTIRLGRSVRVRPEDLEKFIEKSIYQDDEHLSPINLITGFQKNNLKV